MVCRGFLIRSAMQTVDGEIWSSQCKMRRLTCDSGQSALSVLDMSCPWVPVCPSSKSASYGEAFVASVYEPTYLQVVNPHLRDSQLVFDAASHTYFVDGRCVSASVSCVASLASKPFDGEAVIRSMQLSRYQAWPRLRYVIGAVCVGCGGVVVSEECFGSGEFGVLLVEAGGKAADAKTRAAITPLDVRDMLESIELNGGCLHLVAELLRRACDIPGCEVVPGSSADEVPCGFEVWSFQREMGVDEILQFWRDVGEEARNRGTDAHYQIELWLNREICRVYEPEVSLALRFMGSVLSGLRAKAYRTEWRIFGEHEDLAGSIDFAARLPGGALVLVDWKRSDKLRKGTRSFGSRMLSPLEHLQDCKCAVYSLQLNLYR